MSQASLVRRFISLFILSLTANSHAIELSRNPTKLELADVMLDEVGVRAANQRFISELARDIGFKSQKELLQAIGPTSPMLLSDDEYKEMSRAYIANEMDDSELKTVVQFLNTPAGKKFRTVTQGLSEWAPAEFAKKRATIVQILAMTKKLPAGFQKH